MKVAFTATRYIEDSEEVERVRLFVLSLPPGTEVIVGACRGGDWVIAKIAHAAGYKVHTVVPGNRQQVAKGWREVTHTFEEMPRNSSYRDRNTRMVELADEVRAVAQFKEESTLSKRSGTWMTVRIARRVGKMGPILVLKE